MKHSDLVFDVGMHKGEDTQCYLERGFRVVAVEANPSLCDAARSRFAGAIEQGRLTIVEAAIAERAGSIQFATSDEITVWSSTDQEFLRRATELGATFRYVAVKAIRFVDLLAEFGVPHYLKIDIEGADLLCVRGLREVIDRPDYVSIESAVTSPRVDHRAVFDELAELWTAGYRQFKFVDQHRLPEGSPPDSSGPFGEKASGRWKGIEAALAQAVLIRIIYELGGYGGRWQRTILGRAYAKFRIDVLRRPQGWYDLHARLPSAAV